MKHRFRCIPCGLIVLLSLLFFWGCKDTAQTDTSSLLEQCRIYLDEGKWSDAIKTCEKAGGDDGYHYAAQAYMAQGGLSLFNLIKSLSEASDSSGSATAIFGFVPETAAQKLNLKSALRLLMGTRISNKSQTVYFEGLLVSSILVFTELQNVFGLKEVDGSFTTCDVEITAEGHPDKCSFTIDVSDDTPPLLTFTGLGSSFYESLCCDLNSEACTVVSSTTDTTSLNDPSADYDVTIDHCTMEAGSVLQYNKSSYDNFLVTDAFKDSNGVSMLAPLDFYTKFDTGNRYSVDNSGDEIPLCKSSVFTDITSADGNLYDCEVIGSVTDPSSDLF